MVVSRLEREWTTDNSGNSCCYTKTFKANIQDHMLVTMETVRENIRAGADVTLIDSREPKRYAGVEELVDHKAGHIPTAVNHF